MRTVRDYLSTLPPAINPGDMALQVEAFMHPNNLSIF
jgi:hypothetical protein